MSMFLRLRFAVGVLVLLSGLRGQDTQVYEEYRRWVSMQPVSVQRGPDVEARYREHLRGTGLDEKTIEERLQFLRTQGRRMEVERWNRILTSEKPTFNTAPNAFLVEMVKGRKPGKALDVGMGQGRNAIWLARQGWQVTGFDPADQALDVAQRAARALGLKIETVNARFETFDFGENKWDLILLSYAGCTGGVVEKVEKGLKPGGIVVIEAFHEDAAKKFRIGGSICATGEPPQAFTHLRTVHFEEPIAMPDFGAQRMRLSRYVGEKPQP